MDDENVEATVAELRDVLATPDTVPVGMMSRLEAGTVQAARARLAALPWEARVTVACLVFISLGNGAPATTVLAGLFALVVVAGASPRATRDGHARTPG